MVNPIDFEKYPFITLFELAQRREIGCVERGDEVVFYVKMGTLREVPLKNNYEVEQDMENMLIALTERRNLEIKKAEDARNRSNGFFPFNNAGKRIVDLATEVVLTNRPRFYRAGTFLPKKMTVTDANEILDKMSSFRKEWERGYSIPKSIDSMKVNKFPNVEVFCPYNLFTIEYEVEDNNPENIRTRCRIVQWYIHQLDVYVEGRKGYPLQLTSEYNGSTHHLTLQFQQMLRREDLKSIGDAGEYFTYDYRGGASSKRQHFFISSTAAIASIGKFYKGSILN